MESTDKTTAQGKPAWGGWKPVNPAPASLSLVMDEEMARQLEHEEKSFIGGAEPSEPEPAPAPSSGGPDDTGADAQIAALLQEEFDREHDQDLRKLEKHVNGNSSVTISFSNYKRSVYAEGGRSDDNDDVDDEDDIMPQGTSVTHNSGGGSGSGSGGGPGRRRRQRGGMCAPTKHDPVISGQRNAKAAEERLPADMHVGVMTTSNGEPMQLDNRTYNQLMRASQQGGRKSARMREVRDHATTSHNLDPKTVNLLQGLITNGCIAEIGGLVSLGKEATVHHAFGPVEGEDDEIDSMLSDGEEAPDRPHNCEPPPAPEYALKIFKTTLTDFKTRDRYIRDDMRFKDRLHSQNPRKIVHIWAEKEMRNLQRLQKAGLPSPEPIHLREHVLVMSFIGRNGIPAPQLKNARLDAEQMQRAYEQSIMLITRMFKDCNLVHADFSPYNLLWHDQRLYIIDVSQSVEPWHQDAMSFFHRDVTNLLNFFRKAGVPNVADARDVITKVTGFAVSPGLSDRQFVDEIGRLADKCGRDKRGYQHGSPPEESFGDMYERAVLENAHTRAEKEAYAALESTDEDSADVSPTCDPLA